MTVKTYSISELHKEFGVTARAIRFYEDQGLLTPARAGSRRIYYERDRVRLRLILRGKRLGFSLAEIREMFELYDSDPGEIGQLHFLLAKIAERRAILQQQRRDIDAVLEEMARVERRAHDAIAELKRR